LINLRFQTVILIEIFEFLGFTQGDENAWIESYGTRSGGYSK